MIGLFGMGYITLNQKAYLNCLIVVHIIFVLDTAQTFMSMADAFHWFVYGFGDPTRLLDINLASINVPVFDALVAFIVQLVYCWRVWVLGRWRLVPVIIAFVRIGFPEYSRNHTKT
jgi:hypothetical protein